MAGVSNKCLFVIQSLAMSNLVKFCREMHLNEIGKRFHQQVRELIRGVTSTEQRVDVVVLDVIAIPSAENVDGTTEEGSCSFSPGNGFHLGLVLLVVLHLLG